MSDWNEKVIKEFRANGGKVGGPFAGADLLLLQTTGARSGLERITPLVYLTEGEHYVVVASNGGAPNHPDWYHNIVANAEVRVEVGQEQFKAQAAIATEPQRTALYEKMEAVNSGFTAYRNKTTRVIPVIILTRKP